MRVAHVITGLEMGGAEMMLLKLLSSLDRSTFEPLVVSLIKPGPMLGPIRNLGVRVETLGMRRGLPAPGALIRLIRLLRAFRPDLIQSWMYHADLLSALVKPLVRQRSGHPALVWNIRQSDLDPRLTSRGTRFVARLNAPLSYLAPDRILCCSERAREVHEGLGYCRRLMRVIPNGFDLDRFRPDPAARAELREALGIAPDALLVGLVARFDPQKDVDSFLRAAAMVRAGRPGCRFLVCGPEMDTENAPLAGWIAEAGLGDAINLLGARRDTPRVFAALDLLVSSSAYGEGFPNVVGEAMACAVPCVVTDVGDSGRIVGDTGMTVAPRRPDLLARAIADLLGEGPDVLARRGRDARARVQANYALPVIADTYATLYLSLNRGTL